jgi:histidine phosphotransferase ChpT
MSSSDIAAVLELLSSRICHDLISPVGAINNGIEFMEDAADDPESIKQASELIAHSAQSAASRLQAFRIAYGAGGRDGNVKPEDVQKAFGNLTRADGKVRQAWDPFGPLGVDIKTRGFCKVLMGGLMLAAECLPKGGIVAVDPSTDNSFLIHAEGTDAVLREGVDKALEGVTAVEDLDPRLVHPYALSLIARSYNFTITNDKVEPNKVTFRVRYTGGA